MSKQTNTSITEAIQNSINWDRIEEMGDIDSETHETLITLSDDYADMGASLPGRYDYWGTDYHGNEWRIHATLTE